MFQSTRPMRGATYGITIYHGYNPFQSTRPMRGATLLISASMPLVTFQSTRPMRGATSARFGILDYYRVSIHAPRVGRDCHAYSQGEHDGVSIHAPRVGRDVVLPLPLSPYTSFNPRAPCGARLSAVFSHATHEMFQSTRPVWGATGYTMKINRDIMFQSTRPVWGATSGSLQRRICAMRFNPRAPCGARQRQRVKG